MFLPYNIACPDVHHIISETSLAQTPDPQDHHSITLNLSLMCVTHRIRRDVMNRETPDKYWLFILYVQMRLFFHVTTCILIQKEFNLTLEAAAAPIGNVKIDVSEASIQGHF